MKVVPVITAIGETVAVRVITAVCLVTAALVATEGEVIAAAAVEGVVLASCSCNTWNCYNRVEGGL